MHKPTEVGQELANSIISEKQIEEDAMKAKALLEEYQNWTMRSMNFIKETGAPAQEPSNFLRNVLLTYAMKKLDSKIITPN